VRAPQIAKARVAARQPRLAPATRKGGEIHLATASLARGGAERIVIDTCGALARSGRAVHLIVLYRRPDEYAIPACVRVSRVGETPHGSLQDVAHELSRSPNPLVLAHLLRKRDLEKFWHYGVVTIPVVHNMSERWLDDPGAYRHRLVPCAIAVAGAVAGELRAREPRLAVGVVRHDLAGRRVDAAPGSREKLRALLGLDAQTLLIGMIGNFKLHKGYPRALRVLAEVLRLRDARLLVAGTAADEEGRTALRAAREQARRLGVERFTLFAGPVARIEPLLAAFDVFLSTSLFEGLSVAALEARAAGLPLVLSAAGGQAELRAPNVTLLPPPFEPREYAAAVLEASAAAREPRVGPAASHRLWALYGRRMRMRRTPRPGILFLTANLNAGGAQRSLFNLLSRPVRELDARLCVTHPSTSSYFLDRLRRAGVPVFRACDSSDAFDIAEALVDGRARGLPRLICFWNVDPRLKLLLTKVLAHTPVHILDVSPGPAMYAEMDATADFQNAIAFGSEDYYARLDALVVKYAGGVAEARFRAPSVRIEMIPNGVALPSSCSSRANGTAHLVSAGRIAPTKHPEVVLCAMKRVWARHPGCELHVAGQAEPRFHRWFERLWADARLHRRVRWLGPMPDLPSRVRGYAALLLASEQQGCPNTSLEALAAGVPVIANDDGGTREQVIDGETGFLLPSLDATLYAERALRLLGDPGLRERMGANGRAHVARNFSLETMRERYLRLMRELLGAGANRSGFERRRLREAGTAGSDPGPISAAGELTRLADRTRERVARFVL
jgi:glycosyltransferase involved in cell wall biosynthesis